MEQHIDSAKVSNGATTGNVVVTVGGLASSGMDVHRASCDFRIVAYLRRGRHNSDDCGHELRRNTGHEHSDVQRTAATIVTWSNTAIAAKVPTGNDAVLWSR